MTDSAVHVLAVCPGRMSQWPEPLATLVAWGQVQVEIASSLPDAAASLVQAPERIDVLLVDVQTLTPGEIRLLSAFKQHKALSIWLLPTKSAREKLARSAGVQGALPWDCAIQEMAQWPQVAFTRTPPEGSSQILEKLPTQRGTASDNVPPDASDDFAVSFDLTAGYDALTDSQVSDRQLHARLGMATLEV